jgi:hypothetical protein
MDARNAKAAGGALAYAVVACIDRIVSVVRTAAARE